MKDQTSCLDRDRMHPTDRQGRSSWIDTEPTTAGVLGYCLARCKSMTAPASISSAVTSTPSSFDIPADEWKRLVAFLSLQFDLISGFILTMYTSFPVTKAVRTLPLP